MTDRIPLARPAIGDAERAAADRALASGRLVLGPENERFAAALAEACGRSHAIPVASGTAALELAMWALGVGPGDEVLVTSFGFLAAANAVARLGATPVPVDVEPAGWTVDVGALSVGPKTRGLVSIDQLGLVADAGPLEAWAEEHGLWLLDDAACGLGGIDAGGRPGGGKGRVSTLSFHPRKVVTTGEGGAVLTDDDLLAETVRQLRNHGQRSPGSFARVGTNARLGEVAAAVGAAQMARLDAMVTERNLLAAGYRQRLAPIARAGRLSWQTVAESARHSYQTFAVLLAADVDRDAVRKQLDERGIEAGAATYAFHRLPTFAGAAALPRADALHDRGLALPLYLGMRSAELDRVAEAVAEAVG